MNRLQVTICCVTLASAGLSGFAVSAGADQGRLAAEDFAILPWGGTPGDADVLHEIYECGFNVAGFVGPEHVDLVQQAGLKCLVSDPRITGGVAQGLVDELEIAKRVKTATDPLRDHPAVFGWYLRDEPLAPFFDVLAKWCDAFRSAVPEHRRYVNLFPLYAEMKALGVKTYEEYVELCVTKLKPQFISYDNYSLMADGSLRGGYFANLEIVRAVSLKHGIPFWNIVLSNSHFHYADPTETGLRFQMYTTLAYGARGISYFTYFTPKTGNYRLGPIDQFGHKTPTWDMLRRVNLQIHKLGPTYITLKSVNVFHHPNVPEGCSPIATHKFVEEVSGGDFVVGEFEDADGRPYALVVNKSLTDSARFNIRFSNGPAIRMINAYTGKPQGWGREQNWLAPGQGMLLTVEKPRPTKASK